MLKLKRALLILFSAVLFSACSQFLGNVAVFREDSASFSDYIAVRGILANYRAILQNSEELHSSQQSARLIRPTMTSTEYDFYIYGQKGQNDVSSIFGPEKIYPEPSVDGSSGTFQFNVPKGIWTMTLAAVSKGSTFTQDTVKNRQVASTALLWGSCLMDTQNLSMDSNFVLSDAGLKNPGTINIPLTLDGWSFPKTVTAKAGLYYLKTGKAVEKTEQTLTITGNDISNYAPQDGEGAELSIEPGSYTFKLTLYDSKNTEWIWTDQIHVYPGRSIEKELFIPKLINEKPASPEEFAFSLDANPTDQSDYYSGTFAWKVPDSGTTATEYELRLYDEGSGKEYITYTRKNEGSILVRSGSLDSSSTSIQLWLPLGRNLSAQLRAKNRTGTSDEAWESTKIKNINLYRITYNLQGGSVQNDSVFGSGTSGTTGAVCRYGSVSDSHQWIIPGADDITDSDDNRFDFWSTSTAEDAPALDTDEGKYAGYENVELYAHYKANLTHPLIPVQPGDGGSNDYSIFIKYSSSQGYNDAISITQENPSITITKGSQLNLYVATTGFEYKSVDMQVAWQPSLINFADFIVDGINCKEAIIAKANMPTEAGTYKIIIQGTDEINSDTIEISQFEITLNITD